MPSVELASDEPASDKPACDKPTTNGRFPRIRILILGLSVVIPLLLLLLFHPSLTTLRTHCIRGSFTSCIRKTSAALSPSFLLSTPLSQLSAYSDHYQPPPTNVSTYDVLSSLQDRLSLADETVPTFPTSFKINRGFTVDSFQATTGYTRLESLVNPFCPRSLSRVSLNPPSEPPCLSVIPNAFVGLQGVVLQPHNRTIYELGGGCCSQSDWKNYLNATVKLSSSHLHTVRPGRIILNLVQHHGSSYHHVIHEVLPRYLNLVPLVEEAELLVLVDEGAVIPLLLNHILRLPLHQLRIHPAKDGKDNWFYGGLVLVPPPIFQRQHVDVYPDGLELTTAAVLKDIAGMNSSTSANDSKGIIVLMERALHREKDGSCQETRCIKNFEELRRGLERKLGERYEVVVYKADTVVDVAVHTFERANVVVGFHGAGFQNIMFCRKGVTVVHIGYAAQYTDLAENFGLRYHYSKARGTSWGMTSIVLDVEGVVQDVARAIEKDEAWRRSQKFVNETRR